MLSYLFLDDLESRSVVNVYELKVQHVPVISLLINDLHRFIICNPKNQSKRDQEKIRCGLYDFEENCFMAHKTINNPIRNLGCLNFFRCSFMKRIEIILMKASKVVNLIRITYNITVQQLLTGQTVWQFVLIVIFYCFSDDLIS